MRRIIKNQKGTTLVELVVTFLLLTMLCTGVVFVITSCMGVFQSASSHARAQSVSQTLLDKISGEISGAQPGATKAYGVTVSDGTGTLGFAPGGCIDFCSRTGSRIYITASDGYLLIHYRPITDSDHQLSAVDWTFDEKVYNGFTLGSLDFSIAASNVILVRLTLVDSRSSYEYSSERYVQCFNYDAASVSKISVGQVKSDQELD